MPHGPSEPFHLLASLRMYTLPSLVVKRCVPAKLPAAKTSSTPTALSSGKFFSSVALVEGSFRPDSQISLNGTKCIQISIKRHFAIVFHKRQAGNANIVQKSVLIWNIATVLVFLQTFLSIVIGCFYCLWRCSLLFTGAVCCTA